MRYAIFTKNSWWRGVTQDDHVVFYIREAESDEEILSQLDPDSKYEGQMVIGIPGEDDFLKTFNVDRIVAPVIGWI